MTLGASLPLPSLSFPDYATNRAQQSAARPSHRDPGRGLPTSVDPAEPGSCNHTDGGASGRARRLAVPGKAPRRGLRESDPPRRLLGRGAKVSAGREAARPPSLPGPRLPLPPREARLYLRCAGLVGALANPPERGSTFGRGCGEVLQLDATNRNGDPLPLWRPWTRPLRFYWLPPAPLPRFTGRGGIFSMLLEEITVYCRFETRLPAPLSLASSSSRLLARDTLPAPLARPQRLSGVVVCGM